MRHASYCAVPCRLIMTIIWLCGVEHHRQRMLHHGRRVRLRLPQVPWLEAHLQRNDVRCPWHVSDEVDIHPSYVVGLASIAAGVEYEGPLTAWPREAYLQHEYFLRPLDAFSVSAKKVFMLAVPIPIFDKIDTRGRVSRLQAFDGICFPCGLTQSLVEGKQGCELTASGSSPCSVAEVLHRWNSSPRLLGSYAALMMVRPMAELFIRRALTEIVVLCRWPGSASLVPPSEFPRRSLLDLQGQHEAVADTLWPLDLDAFSCLLDDLRRWAPHIIASCAEDEEAAAGERLRLERHARWAQQSRARFSQLFADSVRQRFGTDVHEDTEFQGRRFSSRGLVSAVLFAWHLRDNVGLKDALPHAVDHILPGWLSHGLLAGGLQMSPSRSVLQTAQIAFDLALMMTRREEAGADAARYGWADSSTVAKSDWLISKFQAISGSAQTLAETDSSQTQ